MWIHSPLHSPHKVHRTLSEFFDEVFFLSYSDAVLACARSVKGKCAMDEPVDGLFNGLELFLVSDDHECVEVS